MPFNIFEPRYLEMINYSILHDVPIAVLKSQESGIYTNLVCVAGTVNVIQENPDRTKVVTISGAVKIKLLEEIQKLPFKIYQAQVLTEDKSLSVNALADLDAIRDAFYLWIKGNVSIAYEREKLFGIISDNEKLLSYATHFLVDEKIRQRILELDSFQKKIQLIKATLLPREISLSSLLPPMKLHV